MTQCAFPKTQPVARLGAEGSLHPRWAGSRRTWKQALADPDRGPNLSGADLRHTNLTGAYNGPSNASDPLFLFNQFGDCEAAKLRSGRPPDRLART